jgi:IclR family transcriptional regulator, mhp operon transcriptional activator
MALKRAQLTSRGRRQTENAPVRRGNAMGSVLKTIRILKVLNERQVSSVDYLNIETGIPKATILRIIETLIQSGLVQQISRRAGYCLTSQILHLSSGYFGLPAVIETGAPFAEALTRDLLWPAAIACLDDDAMVVRYSTMPRSPHAHVKSTMNKRLSLVERAHGRAYLAFCNTEERETLLAAVGVKSGNSSVIRDRGKLLWALNAARRLGYAKRAADLDPKTSTIAAPILVNKTVRGTLGLTFFSGAVDRNVEGKLAQRLIKAATAIGEALQRFE